MPVLIDVSFPAHGPWGDEMATQYQDLANSINGEPGFIWKVWTEDEAGQRAGGIYLFEDRASAEAYVAMHTERLAGFGITGVEAVYYDVNTALSTLNRACLKSC